MNRNLKEPFRKCAETVRPRLKKANRSFWNLWTVTRWTRYDLFLCGLVFFITFFIALQIGHWYYANNTRGYWYQPNLARLALGKYASGKLQDVKTAPGDKVEQFMLAGTTGAPAAQSFSANEVKTLSYRNSSDGMFAYTYTLPSLLAWWWKLIGEISWRDLFILLALFHGATAAMLYFVLRQCSGWLPSFALSVLWGCSANALFFHVLLFRDYSRAVFIFAVLGMMLCLTRKKFTWPKMLVCGVSLGILAGLGNGMRNDFIVLLPFWAAAVIFFNGRRWWSYPMKKIFLLAACFLIAWGIQRSLECRKYTEHRAFGHVFYIGLASEVTEALSVKSEHSNWVSYYSDLYGYSAAGAIAWHKYGRKIAMYDAYYDKALTGELIALVRHFPYDFALMGWSAVFSSLRSEFSLPDHAPLYAPIISGVTSRIQEIPPWVGVLLPVLALLIVGLGSYGRFLLLAGAGCALSGIYLLQFQQRHYFFIYALVLLSFAFLLALTIRLLRMLLHYRTSLLRKGWSRRRTFLLRFSLMLLTVAAAVGVTAGLKIIQQRQLTQDATVLATAPKELLKTEKQEEKKASGESVVSLRFPEFSETAFKAKIPSGIFSYCEYLLLEFDFGRADGKPPERLALELKYRSLLSYQGAPGTILYRNRTFDFTKEYILPVKSGIRFLFVAPMYFFPGRSDFVEIRMPAGAFPYLCGAYRLKEPEKMFTNSMLWLPVSAGHATDLCARADWKVIFGWKDKEKKENRAQ